MFEKLPIIDLLEPPAATRHGIFGNAMCRRKGLSTCSNAVNRHPLVIRALILPACERA